ncbi:MAG: hypothetical protein REH79_03600 [Spiroplasma sp.]|nr:hypothetical protein [Spiroplasma sp.]
MKKSLTKTKRTKAPKIRRQKLKSFSFVSRIGILIIMALAIIISTVFSIFYLDSNRQLSIEFAGGYQTQVRYEGIYQEKQETQNIVNLLENRIDPMGTSNINIEKSDNTDNFYNLSISKDAGIDTATFINNLSRRGYIYILDKEGHDLLANSYNEESKTWTKKEERTITKDAFSKISESTNQNSHQPEVVLDVKATSELMKTIQALIKEGQTIYFYSDIGSLLNYIRNTLTGLQDLVKFIEEQTDANKQKVLKLLLANNTAGLDDTTGEKMYQAVKDSNSTPAGKQLINLLNQSKNGLYMINWMYSETSEEKPLLVDTNNKENTFDPNNPFDPDSGTGSPMNAWLPHIKDLIVLPDISRFLETSIISYKYAPYYIGEISSLTNPNLTQITINDDTFNKGKVQQIVNLLNAGMEKNNFIVDAFLTIDPTLGSQALKGAVIALLVALASLSILILMKYRLLGFIAIFIIVLFLVVTLVSFTFLNNVVAPETGIALIIGFALLLDLIIGLFDNLKKEYQTGKNIFDAFRAANKKSLVSAFDCSLIVLIVSLTIFWFGSRSIRGFAIMTSISTFGVIVLGVLILRLVLYLLLKNKSFEHSAYLLGLAPKQTKVRKPKKQSKFSAKVNQTKTKLSVLVAQTKTSSKNTSLNVAKWNYNKLTKWILVGFATILLTSGIVFLAAGANFSQGFDSRIDFTGETFTEKDVTNPDFDLIAEATERKDQVVEILQANNRSYQKVYWALKLNSLAPSENVIKIIIETSVKDNAANDLRQFLQNNATWASWNYTTNNALSGNQLFRNMLIAIAIALITIFIYIIIRFQFSFAMPLIIALIFAIFVTLAALVLFQITISTMTIGVILAIVILVLINSVIIFDNIKEIKLNLTRTKNDQLEKDEIIAISNQGVKRSLPRTMIANSIIIITALIVLCFLPSFWAVSLALILGSMITFLACHFLGPWLWTYFERWRIRKSQKRAKKIKKHFVGPDEYIIAGIND